ncbi:Dihydroneopterin aldolase [Roseivivax sp. THAF40]|uniref:dihydroneopterin aldolase n=1 Tax=unclassified Roseivivax TaxID=2639302 RepID=UPI001268EC82|nr:MULTISPECIES: dihydroneopterin aldolase [unclassified Roseivivax]QFS83073.1 Dihydroneopterin aldolase [Roseivivax sp. THAF197b]QFT46817.1 Dihydroneopterin aldolase [Roseivivax sp. THAF40]
MTANALIELTDLEIDADIGTYGPEDVVPEAHILDLTLHIAQEKVLIAKDGMAHVFDYDPLVAELEALAADGHYHTQERLISRMAAACAAFEAVEALEIGLRKRPVRSGKGALGVRLILDAGDLARLRKGTV